MHFNNEISRGEGIQILQFKCHLFPGAFTASHGAKAMFAMSPQPPGPRHLALAGSGLGLQL